MNIKRRQILQWGAGTALGWVISQQIALNRSQPPLEKAIAQNPLTPDSPLLRFISVADTGTGAQGQYAVASAMAQYAQRFPCELVILAGDNIYNEGEIEKIQAVFEDPYRPLLQQGIPFYACLGNHDIRTDNGVPQTQYPLFNMGGKRYYSFRQKAVQFWALDTNSNADWANQLAWLEQGLKQSDAPWKIVFGHHQIYSSAHYGLNNKLIPILTPLFQKYGVQLYINGHDHVYERTHAINGTTYLICGAGAGVRDVGHSDWTAYSASRLSFAAYEVYGDRLTIQGIGTNYQVFDRGVVPIS